eukprot:GILK01000330.1.p1 GENE.GILK01000330.1~~GILK01000330.1.p1  ORF type:complete len:127 (+),score=22.53 GILK01000330.1:47-382(+)
MADHGNVKELRNVAEYNATIESTDKLIVVDCYATWCGPCKRIAPKIIEWSNEFSDVQFCKVDVDEAGDIAELLGVTAMPTFFFIKNKSVLSPHTLQGANEALLRTKITELK